MTEIRVELCDSLRAVEPVWHELGRRSGNPFLTWEWAETWWRHFRGRRRPLLGLCRDHGRPIALLPLCASLRPVRLVRWIGHGQSDLLGPVCAPEDTARAFTALGPMLEQARRWDLLLAEGVHADAPWPNGLTPRTLRRTQSPTLVTEGRTWNEFLASGSRNFREQVRRRERKLARGHSLRFRLSEDSERLERDLDVLFRLHRARWGEQVEGEFAGRDEAFHRSFARLALERGWLRLWTMELDGEPVAVWYGFRFEGVEWYYQAGRDPAWDQASVGFVLLSHSIRAAFEDGMREYRFLRGGEGYKDRFANHGYEVETVAMAGGPLGSAAIAAARNEQLLPRRLRRLLAR